MRRRGKEWSFLEAAILSVTPTKLDPVVGFVLGRSGGAIDTARAALRAGSEGASPSFTGRKWAMFGKVLGRGKQ